MRLRAIHLREVGPFLTNVSVTGIAPGLNVLAAPNEAGKSTVFRAVEVLFREKHTSTRKHTPGKPPSPDTLRPLSGGAPFVACDFEADGTIWRLEKQFLQQRSALLARLDGRERYRGDEVDARLGQLLGGGGLASELLALVWVGQGTGLEWSAPDASHRSGLDALIAREADAAAGLDTLKATRQAVARDLDQLMTEKRSRARKGGALDLAESVVADWQGRVEEARAVEVAAAERRKRATALKQELAQLSDPQAIGREKEHRDHLHRRQQDTVEADRRLASAEQAVALRYAELRQLQDQARRLEERRDQIARITSLQDAIVTHNHVLAAAEADLEHRRTAVETVTARIAGLEARREVARLRERMVDLQRDHDDVAAVLVRAQAAEEAVRAGEADVAAANVTSETVAALEALEQAHATAVAKLDSGSPRIEISYAPGVTKGFEVDGAPLTSDADLIARELIEIVVPGVGQVRISPAMTRDREAHRAESDARLSELRARLDGLGLADLEAAREAATRHADAVQALHLARQRLGDFGRDGAAGLAARLADLSEQRKALMSRLADLDADQGQPTDQDTVDALEAQLKDERSQFQAVEEAHAAAVQRHRDQSQARERDRLKLDQAQERVSQIDGELRDRLGVASVDAETIAGVSESLPLAMREARQILDGALSDRDTARAALVSSEERAELNVALDAAEAAISTRADRTRQANEALIALRAEMAMDGDRTLGLGEQRRIAEEELAAAEAHHARVELRTRALLRLEQELDQEIQRHAASTVAPIVERMRAMGGPVFGEGRLHLDDDLEAGTFARGVHAVPLDRLSGGTQEQIAILARLAYAELLADAGHPLPVVLDDALVFADDQRRQQVFAALAHAARRHQVIVLTCHVAAFEALCEQFDATRLGFVSDEPARLASA